MSELARLRRMPLRDLLTHTDRKLRELNEHLQMDFLSQAEELYELSRPRRKKSHFPQVRAVVNGYEKARKSYEYGEQLQAEIMQCVQFIRERAEANRDG